jgi:hypothetical protein
MTGGTMPDRWDSHLDTLGVVHYVVAGLVGLFALLPLIHVAMGLGIVTGRFPLDHHTARAGQQLPALFGWMFVVIGLMAICLGLALATALGFAGTFLRQRRRWMYCVVVDALACSLFPFGTVLGVLALVTLSQPEVRARFVQPPAPGERP